MENIEHQSNIVQHSIVISIVENTGDLPGGPGGPAVSLPAGRDVFSQYCFVAAQNSCRAVICNENYVF